MTARSLLPSRVNRVDLHGWYGVSPQPAHRAPARARARCAASASRTSRARASTSSPPGTRACAVRISCTRARSAPRSAARRAGSRRSSSRTSPSGIPQFAQLREAARPPGAALPRHGERGAARGLDRRGDARRERSASGRTPSISSASQHAPPAAAARDALRLPREGALAVYCGHFYDEKGVPDAGRRRAPAAQGDASRWWAAGRRTSSACASGRAAARRCASRDSSTNALVPLHLAAADVLVLPNSARFPQARTTSPLKLFEYMAARRPIVATRIPALAGLLRHGENAWLVAPGQPRGAGGGHRARARLAGARRAPGRAGLARRAALHLEASGRGAARDRGRRSPSGGLTRAAPPDRLPDPRVRERVAARRRPREPSAPDHAGAPGCGTRAGGLRALLARAPACSSTRASASSACGARTGSSRCAWPGTRSRCWASGGSTRRCTSSRARSASRGRSRRAMPSDPSTPCRARLRSDRPVRARRGARRHLVRCSSASDLWAPPTATPGWFAGSRPGREHRDPPRGDRLCAEPLRGRAPVAPAGPRGAGAPPAGLPGGEAVRTAALRASAAFLDARRQAAAREGNRAARLAAAPDLGRRAVLHAGGRGRLCAEFATLAGRDFARRPRASSRSAPWKSRTTTPQSPGPMRVVQPSLVDNLPNAAIESLLLGIPVVAFDGFSLGELVEPGVSGGSWRPARAGAGAALLRVGRGESPARKGFTWRAGVADEMRPPCAARSACWPLARERARAGARPRRFKIHARLPMLEMGVARESRPAWRPRDPPRRA